MSIVLLHKMVLAQISSLTYRFPPVFTCEATHWGTKIAWAYLHDLKQHSLQFLASSLLLQFFTSIPKKGWVNWRLLIMQRCECEVQLLKWKHLCILPIWNWTLDRVVVNHTQEVAESSRETGSPEGSDCWRSALHQQCSSPHSFLSAGSLPAPMALPNEQIHTVYRGAQKPPKQNQMTKRKKKLLSLCYHHLLNMIDEEVHCCSFWIMTRIIWI